MILLFDITYTSIYFILFVAVTALIYFIFPLKKYRWVILLAANIFFYTVAGYKYAFYILFTSATTYVSALAIEHISVTSKEYIKEHKKEWDKEQKKKYKAGITRKKRAVMVIALVVNFGILAFLKYYTFFAPSLGLLLPLGISFYTFQSMGYIVDVYRDKTPAQKNPLKLLLFVSFFPQIIQGPISIYSQLANQLYEPHDFDFTRAKHGMQLILWGFFKKLIIADRAVIAINSVTDTYGSQDGTTLTLTVVLYALQLYADFSGGIDISRGVAQILGIDMIDNFKRPYFSKSINEYWRRWHISLGAWMKDYVFYPVAMSSTFLNAGKKIKNSRFGKTAAGKHIAKVLPTAVASLIVFLIVGIWHGSSMKYVAFGVWNGVVIMLSILFEPVFDLMADKLHINRKNFLFVLFQMFRTFIIVLVGYVFDVAPSFKLGMKTIAAFFTDQHTASFTSFFNDFGLTAKDYIIILAGAIIILISSIIQERHPETNIRKMLDTKPFALRFILIYACVICIIIFGIYGSGYDAADFVYMQF